MTLNNLTTLFSLELVKAYVFTTILKLRNFYSSLTQKSLVIGLCWGMLCFGAPLSIQAQDIPARRKYPQSEFVPPLDIKPALAGSFGEIRGGHFHSGSDYRTNQREGLPVYAVADGYVSRVRVQMGGFGNAVYLTHNNGYGSVYGHLQRFAPRIERILRGLQYRNHQSIVDYPLHPIEIPVKKGEIIAWSGNTGGSGGPHLHFEIRDSKTEETINPQLFGLKLDDKIKPTISGLYMYRLNGLPFNESTPRQFFQLLGGNGKYQLLQNPIINIAGEVGFGIITNDPQPSGSKNGIYSIQLKLDTTVIYQSVIERFFFANSKGVNAHIDYPYYIQTGKIIQKSFIEPGNPAGVYLTSVNRGIIKLTDNNIHILTYTVMDVSGNATTLSYRIKNNPQASLQGKEKDGVKRFIYNQENSYQTPSMKITMPKGTLYDNFNFRYETSPRRKGTWSEVHEVHTRLTPVHSAYELSIKADSSLPAYLKSKALVVNTRGNVFIGTWDKGFLKVKPATFGDFYIVVDTVAPSIHPINISENKLMTELSKISLKITDNLSGISSFTGSIDDQWILMEIDPKTNSLWHTFEDSLKSGNHVFRVTVTDNVGNSRTYSTNFKR